MSEETSFHVQKIYLPTKSVYIYTLSSCIQIVHFTLVNTTKCPLKSITVSLTTLKIANMTDRCTETIAVSPPRQLQLQYRIQT